MDPTKSNQGTPPDSGDEETTPSGAVPDAAQNQEPQDVASLPEWAQAEIKKARDQAAKQRRELRDLQQQIPTVEDLQQQLEEYKQRDLTEAEKAQQRVEAAEKRAQEAEAKARQADLDRLRTQVAVGKGLPQLLASQLVGEDREELEAHADELVKKAQDEAASWASILGDAIKQPKPTPPSLDGERGKKPPPASAQERAADIIRKRRGPTL